MTEIIPLGTASAVPVHGRGFSCVALQRPESVLLFDCGEGTQLRMAHADLKLSRVEAVLVTHLHGDHFFGLMGLLATMSLLHRKSPIVVTGPVGVKSLVQSMPGLSPDELSYDVDFVEIDGTGGRSLVIDNEAYRIWAGPLDHDIPCYGYRYEERDTPGTLDAARARRLGVRDPRDFGRLKMGQAVELEDGSVVEADEVLGPASRGAVFAYITDTRPCDTAVDLAENADILFHEATFADDQSDRAEATGHSTARQAARIALEARARLLLLSHFSARYRSVDALIREAQEIFPDSEAAEEFVRYTLQPVTEPSEQS